MTPVGELRAAFICGAEFWEVFAHPDTGAQLERHAAAGILKVNGQPCSARIVDRLGDGDLIVRMVPLDEPAILEATA